MTICAIFESAARIVTSPISARELSQFATFREFILAFLALYLADTYGLALFHDWHTACRLEIPSETSFFK